jgi:hypothetical protein
MIGSFAARLKPLPFKTWPHDSIEIYSGRLFFCEALCHDGGVEAFAELVGDLVDFVAFVDFDGLMGGVEDDLAVLAASGVGADLVEQFGAELFVEVVG